MSTGSGAVAGLYSHLRPGKASLISSRQRAILLFCLAIVVAPCPPATTRATESSPARTVNADTYHYSVQYDDERLPRLLDTADSVALLSWARFSRPTGVISGSLVLGKGSIDSFQRRFRGQPLHSVQHEYIVPGPSGWWSLHVKGSDLDTETVASVRRTFDRSAVGFNNSSPSEASGTNWPDLARTFGTCGRSLGSFFHVTLHCSTDSLGHSMSYAFFQRSGAESIVVGDLVTDVNRLGEVIRYLYDRDMRMMSLAYNVLSRNRRRYFIHFAGKGDRKRLASALNTLAETARSPRK